MLRSQKARLPSVAALHRNSLLEPGEHPSSVHGPPIPTLPTPVHPTPGSPSPWLARHFMSKGVHLEDTALMVEGLCQELQNPPAVLQEKEPGGGGGVACRHPKKPGPLRLPTCPGTHLTAPSLQAAATRGPRLGRFSSHTARDIYLQGPTVVRGHLHLQTLSVPHLAVHLTWSPGPF